MDLRFSPEENKFREELRTFFREKVPASIRTKVMESRHLDKEEMVAAHKVLHAKGLTVPHWPKQWGGADWTPVQHYIYTEELQFNGVPQPLPFNVSMCGPVVIAFGTEEQKKRFLPRMAALDDWWCQGFSEPGAGSDLAGLKTAAVRQGDHYVVNGQKTWTTLAQYADWIFCLCRTDPTAKKQLGISFLLIDMKTPGITVRPIQTMDGGREVNEVFFDDVKVPVENLVGQEHRGWDCAKFLLGQRAHRHRPRRLLQAARAAHQGAGGAGQGRRQAADRGRALPRKDRGGGGGAQGAGDDADARALRGPPAQGQAAQPEVVDPQDQGQRDPAGDDRSCCSRSPGPWRCPTRPRPTIPSSAPTSRPLDLDWAAPAAPAYFNYRKTTIYGGSNEIQRNILAKAVLGF